MANTRALLTRKRKAPMRKQVAKKLAVQPSGLPSREEVLSALDMLSAAELGFDLVERYAVRAKLSFRENADVLGHTKSRLREVAERIVEGENIQALGAAMESRRRGDLLRLVEVGIASGEWEELSFTKNALGWNTLAKFLKEFVARSKSCSDPTGTHRRKVLICQALLSGCNSFGEVIDKVTSPNVRPPLLAGGRPSLLTAGAVIQSESEEKSLRELFRQMFVNRKHPDKRWLCASTGFPDHEAAEEIHNVRVQERCWRMAIARKSCAAKAETFTSDVEEKEASHVKISIGMLSLKYDRQQYSSGRSRMISATSRRSASSLSMVPASCS